MQVRGATPRRNIISAVHCRRVSRAEKRFRRRLHIYVAALLGAGVLSIAPPQAEAQAIEQLSTLGGRGGFRIDGVGAYDYAGRSVSEAGDVNGDGFDDILIGADQAGPIDPYTGASYVVFGKKSGFGSTIRLSDLNGTDGFCLAGKDYLSFCGRSV